jgi:hypothetical protein
MSKYRGRSARSRNDSKFPKGSVQYLLEAGTLAGMRAAKKKTADILKYHWNYYSELACQRSAIQDEIKQALTQTCVSYEFENWQRAVTYKYGLHPLSTVGSLSYIGGRFNTGAGDFTLSKELIALANELKEKLGIVKTEQTLLETFLHLDWRGWPSGYDVPSNSGS